MISALGSRRNSNGKWWNRRNKRETEANLNGIQRRFRESLPSRRRRVRERKRETERKRERERGDRRCENAQRNVDAQMLTFIVGDLNEWVWLMKVVLVGRGKFGKIRVFHLWEGVVLLRECNGYKGHLYSPTRRGEERVVLRRFPFCFSEKVDGERSPEFYWWFTRIYQNKGMNRDLIPYPCI